MKRSTRKSQATCLWCHTDIPWTRSHDRDRPVTIHDHLPWWVCQPKCPQQPPDTTVGRMP